jgi:hypothetical protein
VVTSRACDGDPVPRTRADAERMISQFRLNTPTREPARIAFVLKRPRSVPGACAGAADERRG